MGRNPETSISLQPRGNNEYILSPNQTLREVADISHIHLDCKEHLRNITPNLFPVLPLHRIVDCSPCLTSHEHCKFLNGRKTVGEESKGKILNCDNGGDSFLKVSNYLLNMKNNYSHDTVWCHTNAWRHLKGTQWWVSAGSRTKIM